MFTTFIRMASTQLHGTLYQVFVPFAACQGGSLGSVRAGRVSQVAHRSAHLSNLHTCISLVLHVECNMHCATCCTARDAASDLCQIASGLTIGLVFPLEVGAFCYFEIDPPPKTVVLTKLFAGSCAHIWQSQNSYHYILRFVAIYNAPLFTIQRRRPRITAL
jgi:hypothetical protein